jgi:hypothetical protein
LVSSSFFFLKYSCSSLATFLWYSNVTTPPTGGGVAATEVAGFVSGGGADGAAGFTGVGGWDRLGGVDRAGALGGMGGGGDSGGAVGLLGPSAPELLITAKDLHARYGGGGATRPTFTLMEGMEGAKDIASLELLGVVGSWMAARNRQRDGGGEERKGGKEGMRGEGLDTHTDWGALVVDKSVWCPYQVCSPLGTGHRAQATGAVPSSWRCARGEAAASSSMASCGLACEVCRDSTWAQHVQTFLPPAACCDCPRQSPYTIGDLRRLFTFLNAWLARLACV